MTEYDNDVSLGVSPVINLKIPNSSLEMMRQQLHLWWKELRVGLKKYGFIL